MNRALGSDCHAIVVLGRRPAATRAIPEVASACRVPHIPGVPTPVIAAVIQREDSYLICRRPAHKRHGGLWEFPGGKLEAGEEHLEAARRELTEELGVHTISVGEVALSVLDPGSTFRIDFVRVVIEGEPTCIEHSEVRWLRMPEIAALNLAPSDRCFVEHALNIAAEAS